MTRAWCAIALWTAIALAVVASAMLWITSSGPLGARITMTIVALAGLGVPLWLWAVRRRYKVLDWYTPLLGLGVSWGTRNRPILALVHQWERDLETAWAAALPLATIIATTRRLRVVFVDAETMTGWRCAARGLDNGATVVVGYRELRDADNLPRPDWAFTRAAFLRGVSHYLATAKLGSTDHGAHHALFREIKLGA